jgi:hypothetical protein
MGWTDKVTKEDYFSLEEIKHYSNDEKTAKLKDFAGKFDTPSAGVIVNKINAIQAAGGGEVIINPMDIKDLDDEGKAIRYDPAQLDKGSPSIFLDAKSFSTFTDYLETTQPVKAQHFSRNSFIKALKDFSRDDLSNIHSEDVKNVHAVLQSLLLERCDEGTS